MKRWLILQNWHITALIAGMGLSAVFLAWTSVNLFSMAVANLALIRQYGAMALADGGFAQFIEISFDAFVSLLTFLLFKGCETEIVKRWRDLHDGDEKSDGTEQM
jgi:hypothetical protein